MTTTTEHSILNKLAMLLKFSIQWEKIDKISHWDDDEKWEKRSSRAYGKFHISSTWHLAPLSSPQLPLWLGYEPSSLSPTPLNTQTAAYDRGNESELQLRHGARTRHRIQFSRSFLTFEPSINNTSNNSTKDEKNLFHCNQEVVVLSLCCWVSVRKHQRSERTFRVKPRKPLWVSIKEVFKVVETWQKLRKATEHFPL